MPIKRNFDAIISKATDALRPLLQEAFEAGRSVGQEEASANLRAKLSNLLSGNPVSHLTDHAKSVPAGTDRATSGSVKPTIEKLIKATPGGLTTAEVVRMTGFKSNSVRGTLWTLGKEGLTKNRGGRWFPLVKNANAVEGAPQREVSTAS